MNTRNQKKIRRDYISKLDEQIGFLQSTYDINNRIYSYDGFITQTRTYDGLIEEKLGNLKELKLYVNCTDFRIFYSYYQKRMWPIVSTEMWRLSDRMEKFREDKFFTREAYLNELL